MARDRWSLAQRTSRVAISTITEAELRFGLANKPGALRLRTAVDSFLASVEILAWDSAAARADAILRQQMNAVGKSLSELDLLIAAHAMSVDAILVSSDHALQHTKPLVSVVDWSTDVSKTP